MPEQTSQQQPAIEVPSGFTLHSENTTHILLPSDNGAFLNPVQEFNRDLSVACIRVWSEEWNRAKEAKWRALQEKKAKKPEKRLKGVSDDCIHWPQPVTVFVDIVVDLGNAEGLTDAKEKEVWCGYTLIASNLIVDLPNSSARKSSYCWKLYQLRGLGRSATLKRSLW